MTLSAIAKWSLAAAVAFTVGVALCAVAQADYANDNKYNSDGALVVDASGTTVPVEIVAGGAGDGVILDGVSSSIKATVKDLTNSNPVAVGIVDGNGDQITSFGGGTQYTEGDTDASITGSALMWEDAGDTLRAVSTGKPLPVDIQDASVAVTGTFWQATQPVSIASTVTVDGSGVTQPVSGSVTANAGSGTFTVSDGAGAMNTIIDSGTVTTITNPVTVTDGAGSLNVIVDSGSITASDPSYTDATGSTVPANAAFVAGTDGTNTRAVKTDAAGELQVDVLTLPALAAGTNNIGDVDILTIAAGDNNIGNVDVVTMPTTTVTATNLDVQIGGSDSLTIGTFPDNEPFNIAQMNSVAVAMGAGNTSTGTQRIVKATGGTATSSQVSDNAASTTILAANTSRRSASVTNDSSAVLYLLVGSGTASATVYTYRLAQYATAIIDSTSVQLTGIWASDPNDGAARVTEIT